MLAKHLPPTVQFYPRTYDSGGSAMRTVKDEVASLGDESEVAKLAPQASPQSKRGERTYSIDIRNAAAAVDRRVQADGAGELVRLLRSLQSAGFDEQQHSSPSGFRSCFSHLHEAMTKQAESRRKAERSVSYIAVACAATGVLWVLGRIAGEYL